MRWRGSHRAPGRHTYLFLNTRPTVVNPARYDHHCILVGSMVAFEQPPQFPLSCVERATIEHWYASQLVTTRKCRVDATRKSALEGFLIHGSDLSHVNRSEVNQPKLVP